MTKLEQYRNLLLRYHALIWEPEWYEPREALVKEMDLLWIRMNGSDRKAAVEYSVEIYERSISAT